MTGRCSRIGERRTISPVRLFAFIWSADFPERQVGAVGMGCQDAEGIIDCAILFSTSAQLITWNQLLI